MGAGGRAEEATTAAKEKVATDALLDHAARMWESERENSDRLSSRIELLSGAIVALLGLGLFSFQWLYEDPSLPYLNRWLTLIIHLLLVAVVLLFAAALVSLFGGDRSEGTSTEKLEFDDVDLGKQTKTACYFRTRRAYNDLKERNANRRLRLRWGQELFGWGMAALLASVLLYLIGSLPAKMTMPEKSMEVADERGNRNAGEGTDPPDQARRAPAGPAQPRTRD